MVRVVNPARGEMSCPPFSVEASGALISSCASPRSSQFPVRRPSDRTPFILSIPLAISCDISQLSAASLANLRIALIRWFMVAGESPDASKTTTL